MDSLLAASARALAAGDPLGALRRVALRDDPPALALRGIAMAQLGDYPLARDLLKRAARGFGAHEALARARCVVADAEVALAMRDLGGTLRALQTAAAYLASHGDAPNAMLARLILARRLLLMGKLDATAQALDEVPHSDIPARLVAVHALIAAELALRTLRVDDARHALGRARSAADTAGVPALRAEIDGLHDVLTRPAARRWQRGREQTVSIEAAAALVHSDTLVIDACRRGVGTGNVWRPLARRPVLFTLALTLARAWPGDASRERLIAEAFHLRRPEDMDETHRARLRVEIGRLRTLLRGIADIDATAAGFALRPCGRAGIASEPDVAVLLPPIDGERASLVALLADGAAWSTSALALALGASQRTVQRALSELEAQGRVRAIGLARARRWMAPPLTEFTTILLLPAGWAFG
ncbi:MULTISPECIES: helix-turn-helix domain-containing protein [Pandoraea]|uniref:helix-turn-helix domain-containing protein n=1 Tax=Pandoraea TaxID=93217 RepID=UPI001F5C4131|nr:MULTISPECIES: helix-turn-helix domain-containing protein [Pandoraea]MCI3204453.1 helix-turn-helix domain-containing protein [Pandoraea sp. LA3]MDN4582480.1 helix-turn-helix domain-containing protein [Pandoraea capi]